MTQLRIETYEIPAADLGPENPLPVFRFESDDVKVTLDSSVPPDERRYFGWRTGKRVLPYRLQDSYNLDRHPRKFKAVVLENEFLKATVLPELGGRLVSLFHKTSGRELLDRNPVFQPANLALRNAWFSGGIEWNAGQPGHHFLTCSPVFAAEIKGPQGEPAVRLYEWERLKRFPWQVDLILPPGSQFLFARIRLVNPHDYEIPMYWWTNMAVPERPDVRTLVPASSTYHNISQRGLAVVDLPMINEVDVTYSTNSPHARECFFRVPDDSRKWVTALDGEGKGLFEASTARLKGRKMFTWGMGGGGRHWQRHLSGDGGAYLEIQAGLARTQLECLPMPAQAHWTWTEAFGLLEADPNDVHSPDWRRASEAASRAIDRLLPQDELDRLDREFAQVTERAPEKILAVASGWGALERERLDQQGEEDRVPRELVFGRDTLGPDQEPWLELLRTGVLPPRDPVDDPGQWMVQPEWQAMLERSVKSARGDNWLAWLHVAVGRYEARRSRAARAALDASMRRRPSSWAMRNLALMETRNRHKDAAVNLMREAWRCGPQITPLAMDCARLLTELRRSEDLLEFVDELTDGARQNERIQIMAARAKIRLGKLDGLDEFFNRPFSSIREGETTLTELWYRYQAKKISIEEGVPMTDALRMRVWRELNPPAHIDFRLHKTQQARDEDQRGHEG